NRVNVPMGIYPAGLEYKTLIHHVRLYNVEKLHSHLSECGYRPIICQGVHFLPQRLLRSKILRTLSEYIADRRPQLCSNLIMVARKEQGRHADRRGSGALTGSMANAETELALREPERVHG